MNQQTTSSSQLQSGADGQQRLTAALDDFRSQLDPADQASLSQTSQPDAAAVTEFSAKFNTRSNLGRKRLGDKIQPFLLFIQSFGDVVGIYIQSDPRVAALVWGSVKLVVQLASNYFEYFVKISDMFVKLQHLCPTIERIGKLFQNSIKLQDAILAFYAIIVGFCAKAFIFLRQSGLKQFAKSIWKPFKAQFADVEGQLEDQRRVIDDEVLIASETAAHEAAQSALIYQKDGYSHRKFEVEQWAGNKKWQLQQDFEAKRRKLNRILEKISNFDHTRSFLNSRDRRHPDTGKWFFVLPDFVDWDETPDSAVLWYHGIPGSGKSILATSVIDHLYNKHRSTKACIVYFFCDFHTPETLRYRAILSSLLKQIVIMNGMLSDRQQEKLEAAYLESMYPPDISQIGDLLISFAKKLGRLYITIDGIDECPTDDMLDILGFCKRLLAKKPKDLKIILSSRPDIDVPRSLKISYNVSLSTAMHRPDLEAYIQSELETKCSNLDLYPAKVKEEVKQALLKGADGMFLWVFFQIQDIRRAGNRDKIYAYLRDLPRGLHGTYARIVRRLNEERDGSKAAMTFKWLFECHRPLTLLELRDAISIRVGDTNHAQIRSRYNDDPQGIIQNCCNLVILNEQDQTVQFAHSTVSKYLEALKNESSRKENDAGRASDTEVDLAQLCGTYLRLDDFGTQVARIQKAKAVLPPKDWVTILLPGKLGVFAPICRSAYDMILGSQCQPNSNGFTTNHLSRSIYGDQKLKAEATANPDFPCLKYITEFWLHHFAEGDKAETRTLALEGLLYELNLPFPYLPVAAGNSTTRDLLSWACENDNVPLFAAAFCNYNHPAQPNVESSQSTNRRQAVSTTDYQYGSEIRASFYFKYAIERGSLKLVKYFLEDPPIEVHEGVQQLQKLMKCPEDDPKAYLQGILQDYIPLSVEQITNTPLYLAVKFGRLQIFDLIWPLYMRYQPSNHGYYALVMQLAISKNYFGVIKCLSGSLKPNNPEDHLSLLLLIVQSGQLETAKYFISVCGGTSKSFSVPRRTPGCKKTLGFIGNLTTTELQTFGQLNKGEFSNHFGVPYDAFKAAVAGGHLEILKLLANDLHGAEMRVDGHWMGGMVIPAFYHAIADGNVHALDILIGIGSLFLTRKVECLCGKYVLNPMNEAIDYGHVEVVRWLYNRNRYSNMEHKQHRDRARKLTRDGVLKFLEEQASGHAYAHQSQQNETLTTNV
ncbi:hypothetical protein TWF281_011170 [Arthrobotrys megalospora]